MSLRDREVLDLLRDEPELLAIADAVADTQPAQRSLRPLRAIVAVTLAAAAIFVLVLASPWDRGGGGRGNVLGRALAAINSSGPVTHMTVRLDVTDGRSPHPVLVAENFYDKKQGLVRVITRREGKVVGDFTTGAVEDEFSFFPGLLEGASFYKQALQHGDARIVGQGEWHGTPVYWVGLAKGGGLILRVGIDRDSYRPVVFRALNPDGTSAGAHVAVLGFDYVSRAEAAFDTEASVLATGRVIGLDCRPTRARVEAYLADDGHGTSSGDIAVVRTARDGSFVLKANPRRSPIREALAGGDGPLKIQAIAIANWGGDPQLIGFATFSRTVKGGRWVSGVRVTIRASKGFAPPC